MTVEFKPTSDARKVGYMRVSKKGQVLTSQRHALKNEGCDPIYYDRFFSGRDFPRPGLSKAITAMRPGDTFVVHRQDRFGRDLCESCLFLRDILNNGWGFKSITQPFDVRTLQGRISYYFNALLAEIESFTIGERTRDGMGALKAQGVRFGRKPKMSPRQALAARRMLDMPDMPLAAVARAFKVSPNSIKRAIQRIEDDAGGGTG